jgi:hypothetical protein
MVAATERQKLANASLKYGPCGNGKVSRNHAAACCTRLGRCYMNHRLPAANFAGGTNAVLLVGTKPLSKTSLTLPLVQSQAFLLYFATSHIHSNHCFCNAFSTHFQIVLVVDYT